MNRLTCRWNKFKKMLYLFQVLSSQAVAIFGEPDIEMTNTMTSNMHLYKEEEEKKEEKRKMERRVKGEQDLKKKKQEFVFPVYIFACI